MPKIDNDPTKKVAKPFLIIASVRCGGTYLAHSLSNHPSVYCDRGESMHEHSLWRQNKVTAMKLLHLLTHQEGYKASGFRMVYSQALSKHVWRWIRGAKPNIIHLSRRNILRQATSLVFHRMVRRGDVEYYPVHTFKQTKPPKVTILPDVILKACKELDHANRSVAKHLEKVKLNVLPVEYSQMVGGEGMTTPFVTAEVGKKICNHLGVCEYPLSCELKRVHQHPLKAMLENWSDVEAVVAHSEFAECLADEMNWELVRGRWTVQNA